MLNAYPGVRKDWCSLFIGFPKLFSGIHARSRVLPCSTSSVLCSLHLFIIFWSPHDPVPAASAFPCLSFAVGALQECFSLFITLSRPSRGLCLHGLANSNYSLLPGGPYLVFFCICSDQNTQQIQLNGGRTYFGSQVQKSPFIVAEGMQRFMVAGSHEGLGRMTRTRGPA